MATMNKPAADNTDWYSDVAANWTTIENDLFDKSGLTAKGDLLAATGSAALSRIPVGRDGDFLVADSAQAAGVLWKEPSAFTDQELIDVLWGKTFFSDEGFLPSTKMFECVGTPPALAGTAGSATWTQEPGTFRPNNSGIGWYDLGAAKSKILVVMGNLIKFSTNIGVILAASAPGGLDPDGYGVWNDANGPCIEKRASGAYTRVDTATGLSSTDYKCGYALYYDDASNTLKSFVRMGSQWFITGSGTDSTYTTLRYVCFQASAANQRFVTPFVCYAQ